MSDRRAIREFALQLLYLLDQRAGGAPAGAPDEGGADAAPGAAGEAGPTREELIAEAVEAGPLCDDELTTARRVLGAEDRASAAELAAGAWAMRGEADALSGELAPGWPATRQPAVDRALLRMGWYEMSSGRTPPRVAINEAIELAKRYSTERSPAFINGLLDKMMRRLRDEPAGPTPPPAPGDAWLADAVDPAQPPGEPREPREPADPPRH